ncbi:putative disease resistance protein RGA1 [Humulus lupulus]|uniref:putative disease resistance protein RGA1 n=1 Tax=Humulus lupulus TaxID=3486 RepID=UPI002B40AE9B|nr:putative disease resistance protein RGA1 [Humulus lupulus]
MADRNLVPVAHRILQLLRSSDLKEIGVVGELSNLKENILAVNPLLCEFQQDDREEFKRLLGKLEGAFHRTENLLEEMLTVVRSRRVMSAAEKVLTFFSFSSPLYVSYKLCYKIDEVKKTVDQMLLKIKEQKDGTFTVASKEEEEVIGRDNDKTEIMKLILHQPAKIDTEEENVRVILVVGAKGMGKTTLARNVYNDDKIQQTFDLRLWAFTGDDCNTTKIVMGLLNSAGVGEPANCYPEMDRLQKELRKAIDGKRCFIVMDDMVDDSHPFWHSLKDLLMGCAKGTCVLLTTCSEKVANITRTGSLQSYHLDRLTEEDSWVLLKRRALISESHPNAPEFEQIGRDIAAKCDGVPLFICVISSILRLKVDLYHWQAFNDVEKINAELKKLVFLSVENGEETGVANGPCKQTHSFVPQEMFIGRDDDKKEIMVKLLDGYPYLVVIPIVGMEGLGKTTLAKHIFDDDKVQCHFDLKIWVLVSDILDKKVIVEKIILSITGNDPKDLDLVIDQLVILLHLQIQQKRYLLVLDDYLIENESEWQDLRDLLSVGANGSRIIITTRSKEAANNTGGNQKYALKKLDEDNSWLLFQKVAFVREEHSTDPHIMKIGKEIVKICWGIPLIIRTIGSILFSKNPETEWQSFHEKELSKKLDEGVSDVSAALQLSYGHLPYTLQDCLSYCALFPKDYEIDVESLITLWMSQGFIQPEEKQHPEDIGYDYFIDLLRRSFFQETKKDELDKITKCKMLNAMHDFVRKAHPNACATIRCATIRLKDDEFGDSLRHLSFDFHLYSSWQIPIPENRSKMVRSFILPNQHRWTVEGRSRESVCDKILKLEMLRALDLHNIGIEVLPNSIGELKFLRYLDLSQNVNIRALPNSISRLQNLQTLKLNHCSNLQKLSRGITKLANLRKLECESCYCLTQMPRGLRRLSELRTLSEFVLNKGTTSVSKQSGKLDELSGLDYLRGKLTIRNLSFREEDKTAEAKLDKKEHLTSLILIWNVVDPINQAYCEETLEDLKPHPSLRELSLSAYGGIKFSSWLPLCKSLVKLSLSRCNSCQCLPPVSHLPNLEVLVVDELMKLEYILEETLMTNESTTSFSSLKELRLTNLPELKSWRKEAEEEETTFTCLSKLVVEDCPKLTSMPLFPCLEELLVLKNTSWEPFKRTLAAKEEKVIPRTSEFEAPSSPSTSFIDPPLSKLKTLQIIHMSKCERNMWEFLRSLRSLTFDHIDDIKALLKGLKQVTTLQQLCIWHCHGLMKIPKWISNGTSLKKISIKVCPNLTIGPDKLSLIASSKVEIEHCPQVSHIESILKICTSPQDSLKSSVGCYRTD